MLEDIRATTGAGIMAFVTWMGWGSGVARRAALEYHLMACIGDDRVSRLQICIVSLSQTGRFFPIPARAVRSSNAGRFHASSRLSYPIS